MALPYGTTGSLCSSFLPVRHVCLPVKHPYAITLYRRLPIGVRVPLGASVTLLEATTPVKLPTKRGPPCRELGPRQPKGRISTAAPQILAYLLHSLRPILHIECPDPTLSYSKGSRGLFVPSRVIGIFTDTTISLGSRLRQCPDHYPPFYCQGDSCIEQFWIDNGVQPVVVMRPRDWYEEEKEEN